jgi:hypothetical protein
MRNNAGLRRAVDPVFPIDNVALHSDRVELGISCWHVYGKATWRVGDILIHQWSRHAGERYLRLDGFASLHQVQRIADGKKFDHTLLHLAWQCCKVKDIATVGDLSVWPFLPPTCQFVAEAQT